MIVDFKILARSRCSHEAIHVETQAARFHDAAVQKAEYIFAPWYAPFIPDRGLLSLQKDKP